MAQVSVCYGQDTPGYYHENLEIPDDIIADKEKLKSFLIDRATDIANNEDGEYVFQPEYDYSGLRIVDASINAGTEVLVQDLPVENTYWDAGLEMGSALNPILPLENRFVSFLDAIRRLGKNPDEAIAALVELADYANTQVQS